MTWMNKWAGGFPLSVGHARAAPRSSTSTATTWSTSPWATPARWPATRRRRSSRRWPERAGELGGVTTMLPTEDAEWVARRTVAPIRPRALVLHALGDRRQPLAAAPRAPGDRTAQGPGLLVLATTARSTRRSSWLEGGRTVVAPGQRRARRSTRRRLRAAVEFNDLAALEARAGHGDVAGGPHRAGADQHRHRPARARASSRACARLCDATGTLLDPRRDPHLLGRPRRRDAALGAAPRRPDHRQVARRGRALWGLRAERGPGRRGSSRRGGGRAGHRRRRRRGRHARRQRAEPRRDARGARRGPDRRRLRRRWRCWRRASPTGVQARHRRVTSCPGRSRQLGARCEYRFADPAPTQRRGVGRERATRRSRTTCTSTASIAACCSRPFTTWPSCARRRRRAQVDAHTECLRRGRRRACSPRRSSGPPVG